MPTKISGSGGVDNVAPDTVDNTDLKNSVPFRYAYNSPPQALSVGGLITLTHGLGATPTLVRCELHCVQAAEGYAVGDVIDAPQVAQGTATSDGLSVRRNSTQIIIRQGSTGGLPILNATTGGVVRISNSQWNLVVRASV